MSHQQFAKRTDVSSRVLQKMVSALDKDGAYEKITTESIDKIAESFGFPPEALLRENGVEDAIKKGHIADVTDAYYMTDDTGREALASLANLLKSRLDD